MNGRSAPTSKFRVINVGLGGMTIDSSFSGSTTGFRYNTTPGFRWCTATQTTMFCEFVDYDGMLSTLSLWIRRGFRDPLSRGQRGDCHEPRRDPRPLNRGRSVFAKAIARYSDGSTDDVTNLSLWESSDLEIVTMGDPATPRGFRGTATVTATYSGPPDTQASQSP